MRKLICIAILLLAAGPALAQKTDVIVMLNGDQLTCEIKKLEHGKLTAKTDDMGTLQIKWEKIARASSRNGFLVRTNEGAQFYGILSESTTDRIVVVQWRENLTELSMDDITGLEQIKFEFWEKVTAAAALGFNYTQATSVTQFYFDTSANYRGRVHSFGLGYATNITDKGNEEPIYRRWDASASHNRRLGGRLWSDLSLGGQRNDELGLKLRLLGGLGAGYRFVESSSSDLQTNLGVNVTREWSSGDEPPEYALEGRIGVGYTVFAYDTPKTDIRIDLEAFPSFTVDDRIRSQVNISARREMIKDLFVELKFYESQDNKPPSGDAGKVDRGVVFSVGWSK